MPTAVQRVALYARVSTDDKDQNPETQLRPLRAHVTWLAGSATRSAEVTVLGEFVDRASADDRRGRQEWRRLLGRAMQRQVDLIVVWKLGSTAPSARWLMGVDGAITLQTLRIAGCGIRSLQEPWFDTTTAIGEAMSKTCALISDAYPKPKLR